jgi:hypothetical protein
MLFFRKTRELFQLPVLRAWRRSAPAAPAGGGSLAGSQRAPSGPIRFRHVLVQLLELLALTSLPPRFPRALYSRRMSPAAPALRSRHALLRRHMRRLRRGALRAHFPMQPRVVTRRPPRKRRLHATRIVRLVRPIRVRVVQKLHIIVTRHGAVRLLAARYGDVLLHSRAVQRALHVASERAAALRRV